MTTLTATTPVIDLIDEVDAALHAAQAALERAARLAGSDPHSELNLVRLVELSDEVQALRS